LPLSPGTRTWRTDFSVIDYSNLSDGYLTFAYSGNAERLQVIIHTPTSTHAYELPVSDRSVKAFPLTGGNGAYTVEVLEQIPVDGVNRVNTLDRREFNVSLTDPHTPFLMANYFVNYTAGSSVVTTASTITAGLGEVEKIEAVYNWFVNNVSYDFAFAPPRGYVPDLNVLMNTRKGICFDYASGMVAMLRSQGIPARMETGNARLPGGGSEYHAWVSAYTRATGWVNGWIRFNGSEWVLTDPTWASINNQENNVNFRNHVLNRNNYATLELH
jgi:transglutaminase-like putative cysteine protease